YGANAGRRMTLVGVQHRRLCLIRHARAADGAPDAARRLTDRGVADARALGRWLVAADVVPDAVIVSPATRAVETWAFAAGSLTTSPPPVETDERVYANTV